MLGISTSYFAARGFSIYESVKRARELGFFLIELGANHDFEENVGETLKRIRRDFPKAVFTQHCYFPPVFRKEFLANSAEGLSKKNKKVLEIMFEAGQILRSKLISFHSGVANHFRYKGRYREFRGFKEFVPLKKIPQARAFKNLDEFLIFACQEGRRWGIMVAVENMFKSQVTDHGEKYVLTDFVEFQKILKKLPDLGFLFDYGHAFLASKDPDQFFTLGERIFEIHLHDVKEGVDHQVLGQGEINLEHFFDHVKKLKKSPFLILEHPGGVKEEDILKEKKLVEKYLSAC